MTKENEKRILRVLMVEDSEDDALLVLRELRRGSFTILHERVDTTKAFLEALDEKEWDLILCDYSMPHFRGTDALRIVQERELDVPFIFVSGTIGEDVAVLAMKAGARDYVMKGNLRRLVPAIEREIVEAQERIRKRQAEKDLQESEQRFRTLTETATSAIIIYQGEFLQYVNPAAERILGYTHEELLTKRFWDVIHPDERENVRQRGLARQRGQVIPGTIEVRVVTKSGDTRYVEFTASLIEFAGKPAVLGTAFDITDRKLAEQKLYESEARLKEAQSLGRIGNWELDVQNQTIFWSDEVYRLYERDPKRGPPTPAEEASY